MNVNWQGVADVVNEHAVIGMCKVTPEQVEELATLWGWQAVGDFIKVFDQARQVAQALVSSGMGGHGVGTARQKRGLGSIPG